MVDDTDGVGPERATATAGVLAAKRLDAIWSAGFACALQPAGVGDVLIGTGVIRDDGVATGQPIVCEPSMLEWVRRAVQAKGLEAQRGKAQRCHRSTGPLRRRRSGRLSTGWEDRARHGECGARAGGGGRGLPFTIVRTVSDLVDESLPLDFNLFLRPSGWAKGVAACLAHPSSLIGLNRLQVQSRIAGQQLTALFRACAAQASREGVA